MMGMRKCLDEVLHRRMSMNAGGAKGGSFVQEEMQINVTN